MTARAQHVQATVRKFLGGGSAREISDLASSIYTSADDRKALVESAGVVDRLVDLLVHAREGIPWAVYALCILVQIGPVAQDAIAKAHDGAIFKWLAGPQDHGQADHKNSLIADLTKDHPTNTIRLEVARGDTALLIEFVIKCLERSDNASASLAMNALIDMTRGKGAMGTIPDSSVTPLATIFKWDPTNTDAQLRAIRDQAEFFLVHLLQGDAVHPAAPSTLSIPNHLDVLAKDASDTRRKLLAVLRLNRLVKENKSSAHEIVSYGGFADVAAAVRIDTEGIRDDRLPEEAALLLGTLAQDSASARDQIVQRRGFTSLELLSRSGNPARKAAAMDALCDFLSDAWSANAVACDAGVAFFFELLQYDMQHPREQKLCVVDVLTAVFVDTSEPERQVNLRQAAEGDESIAFLVELMNGPSIRSDEMSKLAEELGGLIPFLLLRVNEHAYNLVSLLKMLECLSRIPANQSLYQEHDGVRRLTTLLKASSSPEVLLRAARILANIACKNQDMSTLIVECEAVESLIRMMKSSDIKIQTAALMALRNLASSDANRIGTPAVVVRLVEMIATGKTMKQRVTAAAVLGSIARLPTTKQQILHQGGDEALLRLLGDAQTPSQVETAAAALWVLTENDGTFIRPRKEDIVKVIVKTIKPHNQDEVPWSTRLLQRLK